MPKNASIALNLLQCLFDTNNQGQSFNLSLARKCFTLLASQELEYEQAIRFEKIKAQADKLNIKLTE